jgi:hypothetical protein
MVRNTSSGETRYLKITTGNEILYSDRDEEFTYKKFFFSPNITYPDCDLCDCREGRTASGNGPTEYQTEVDTELNDSATITPFWPCNP